MVACSVSFTPYILLYIEKDDLGRKFFLRRQKSSQSMFCATFLIFTNALCMKAIDETSDWRPCQLYPIAGQSREA